MCLFRLFLPPTVLPQVSQVNFCFGADSFNKVSGALILPVSDNDIFFLCSADCGPNFLPLLPADIFFRCAEVRITPTTPEIPSPPSVLLCSIPVPRFFRPNQRINLRSIASAPTSVRLFSKIIILDLSLGVLVLLCFTNALPFLPLPMY